MSEKKTLQFTHEFVASALGVTAGKVKEPQSVGHFSKVTTDSRKISEGCLFVAIHGDVFDGHQFIDQAIASGARGIICRKNTPKNARAGVTYFEVDDTLAAYRQLAGAWRAKFTLPVLAVAGSVGKTSTKEILSAILQGKFKKVLKTQGSQNGFLGIAMTLLELNEQVDAAVIEVGIDEPGAMIQHMKLVSATASVLTPIGPEHLEKLLNLQTVAREEGIALTYVSDHGGFTAINLNDPWILPYYDQIQSKKKIGFSLGTDPRPGSGLVGHLSREGSELEIENEKYPLPLPGRHNALNLLAAIAIAGSVGITPSEIRRGLETFQGAEGRSQLRKLKNGALILCDYYNANPTSTEAAFELLHQMAHASSPARPRVVVLGDMLELGAGEESFHRGLAPSIVRFKFEEVFLFGERMKWLDQELKSQHFQGKLKHFANRDELFQELKKSVNSETAALIKGSHSMKMEEIWKKLESLDLPA